MSDLRLGNIFQLASRHIFRRWTRSGTNLVIFLEAFCAQTNIIYSGVKLRLKESILKPNTPQKNFRTFE